MATPPFKNFIITLLLLGKDTTFISNRLNTFKYHIKESDIVDALTEVRGVLPVNIRDIVSNNMPLMIDNPTHVEWLKQLKVFELYDFMVRGNSVRENRPKHFKQCEDCVNIHKYNDIMTLVNILMYNRESYDSISSVLDFKYKMQVSGEALKLYSRIFWHTDGLNAKDAMYFCKPFRSNTAIVINPKTDQAAMDSPNGEGDNSNVSSVVFFDNDYIKWKIGYKNITAKTTSDFLKEVKQDCMFKYQESMSMAKSVESSSEDGTNDMGPFNSLRVTRKNVEEQKARLAKQWIDLFIKVESAIPDETDDNEFFEKMNKLELEFNDDDKIVRSTDIPGLLNDIAKDM